MNFFKKTFQGTFPIFAGIFLVFFFSISCIVHGIFAIFLGLIYENIKILTLLINSFQKFSAFTGSFSKIFLTFFFTISGIIHFTIIKNLFKKLSTTNKKSRQNNIENLENNIENLENNIENLENNIENLEKHPSFNENRNDENEKKTKKLEKKIAQFKKEYNKLRDKNDRKTKEFEKKIAQLTQQLKYKEKDINNLINAKASLDKKIRSLQESFNLQRMFVTKLEEEKKSFENLYQTELRNKSRLGEEGAFVTSGGHDEIVLRLQTFKDQRFRPFAKKTNRLFDNKTSLTRYYIEQVFCEHLFQISGSREQKDIIKDLTHIGSFKYSDSWAHQLQEIINEATKLHEMIASNKSSRGYFTFVTRQYFSSKLYDADRRCPSEEGAFVLFTLFPGYFTLNPKKHVLKPLVYTTNETNNKQRDNK